MPCPELPAGSFGQGSFFLYTIMFSNFRLKRRSARTAMVGALSCFMLLPAFGQTPQRGRDPWAFRLSLDNKTRMLALSLRSNLWASYNPANGTLHQVWSGGIQYRGKVYDFGQMNSTTTGTTYHRFKKAFILQALNETVIPSGWTSSGITPSAGAWTFGTSGAFLATSTFDTDRYDNIIVAYQTPSGTDRLLVDVSNDAGATWTAQHWMSVDGAASDGHQKLLAVSGSNIQVRFRRNSNTTAARLGDISIAGDYRAWSVASSEGVEYPKVDWRGYRLIDKTAGIIVSYDLVLENGTRIQIQESPEAMTGAALSRKFTVQGIPAGSTVSLELDGTGYQATHSVTGGTIRSDAGATLLDISSADEVTLQTTWTP